MLYNEQEMKISNLACYNDVGRDDFPEDSLSRELCILGKQKKLF